MRPDGLPELVARAASLIPEAGRAVLGLAGPPGAGKSTLATRLVAALGERAAYVPLDGFHLSNAQLDRLGLRSRKGSEPSFDVWGYEALLRRLTAEPTREVYVPDFDRTLDEPVAARHHVPATARLVVTEGNYLACAGPGWRAARRLMAEVWYVDAPPEVRDARLMRRHTTYGRSPEAARAWIDANDAPNAALVEGSRAHCDLVLDLPDAASPAAPPAGRADGAGRGERRDGAGGVTGRAV